MKYEDYRLKMTTTPLYIRAKTELIKMIKSGVFEGNKLPPENKLSEILGISRTSIREALMALSKEGIITKKQGIGNLYHLSALNAKMRIDQINCFEDLIKDGGFEVKVEQSDFTFVEDLGPYDIDSPIPGEERFLFCEFIFYADNRPAIESLIFIPESRIILKSEVYETHFTDLSGFLNNYAIEKVTHSINVFKPGVVDSNLESKLKLKKGVAVIQWEEQFYGMIDSLLCFSRVTFHPEIMNLTMLRKWA